MSKISEFFGLYCKNPSLDFKQAMATQICPYTQRICTKMRKSDPEIKIGTCSVKYQNQDVIICPFRLLEHNQIFIDCLHLLTMHEPGNELYLVPEVQIPGGHVDYFLVSAKDKKVKDFMLDGEWKDWFLLNNLEKNIKFRETNGTQEVVLSGSGYISRMLTKEMIGEQQWKN